ncbi:hypothetical protein F5B22DRAFT_131080 [Xylaria bambusicola]|uniref:uncharacterized protein n=1 Tax=Xylaria bambusicola TaxID=326684 RepID=UPI0020077BDD|nr:uncharacterized protein F5B22DRAFT_131080 [Xylaria bambusicola]KAI0517167.1 hypothetical protein F5B22DRAFT_131080 [Xylaria bambusicola]
MASLQSMSGFPSHGAKYRVGKSKVKPAVKPILKKWSHSEKEKKSLDLDRGWDEQGEQYRSSQQDWGRSSSLSFYEQPDGVGTIPSGTVGGVGLGVLGNGVSARRYNHSRSISSTSHASGTTSNSSNGIPAPRQAGATFVHPFQQTPRTSTPPLLSYANSLASIADTRDYSPTTITEDEDNEDGIAGSIEPRNHSQQYRSTSHNNSAINIHCSTFASSNLASQPALNSHLPSLQSQHTSSTDVSDTNSPKPPLRVNTSRTCSSIPTHSSRLANVSSRSDLYLDRGVDLDSPTSNPPPNAMTSPSTSITPIMRTSLDGGFPRLRAKSDLDTATRAEHLREARRKFEIKERAKDEKYAREEIKRREKADNKRAQELEKQSAAQHKEQLAARAREEAAELEEALQRGKHNRKVSIASSGRPSLSMPRPSLNIGRPSLSRRNTPSRISESEKFMSSSYDSTGPRSPPTYGREARAAHSIQYTSSSKHKSKAKKKTQGAWTTFILWLRTKLLRMSRS